MKKSHRFIYRVLNIMIAIESSPEEQHSPSATSLEGLDVLSIFLARAVNSTLISNSLILPLVERNAFHWSCETEVWLWCLSEQFRSTTLFGITHIVYTLFIILRTMFIHKHRYSAKFMKLLYRLKSAG